MKKAPEAFRTISEVAEILETPAHVLRFWESKFYQIRPVKRAGGRRYYRPDDVALISGIKCLLQDRGMTIRGVQRVLQEQGVKHVAGLGAPLSLAEDEDLVEGTAANGEPLDLAPEAEEVPERAAIPRPALRPVETPEDAVEDRPGLTADTDTDDEQTAATETAADDDFVPLDEAFEPAPAGADPAPPPAGTLIEGDEDATEMLDIDPAEAPAEAPDIAPDALAARPEPLTTETSAEELASTRAAARQPLAAETDARDEALAELREPSERAQLARRLRSLPRGALGPRRDRAELIARRIDALLERMSEASGAGRW